MEPNFPPSCSVSKHVPYVVDRMWILLEGFVGLFVFVEMFIEDAKTNQQLQDTWMGIVLSGKVLRLDISAHPGLSSPGAPRLQHVVLNFRMSREGFSFNSRCNQRKLKFNIFRKSLNFIQTQVNRVLNLD